MSDDDSSSSYEGMIQSSNRFDDSNANDRPASRSNTARITRAGHLMAKEHGSSKGAYAEALAPMSREEFDEYSYSAITEGLENYGPDSHSAGGFSNMASHFRRYASQNHDTDDVDPDHLYDDQDIDQVIETRIRRHAGVEAGLDMDSEDEGEGADRVVVDDANVGPGSSNRFAHKSKVAVASLDAVGIVYDQSNGRVTVKIAGEFYDLKPSDCRPVGRSASFTSNQIGDDGNGPDQAGTSDDAYDNNKGPKKTRNDYDLDSDTDDVSMNSFASQSQSGPGSGSGSGSGSNGGLSPRERRAMRNRNQD